MVLAGLAVGGFFLVREVRGIGEDVFGGVGDLFAGAGQAVETAVEGDPDDPGNVFQEFFGDINAFFGIGEPTNRVPEAEDPFKLALFAIPGLGPAAFLLVDQGDPGHGQEDSQARLAELRELQDRFNAFVAATDLSLEDQIRISQQLPVSPVETVSVADVPGASQALGLNP